LSLKERSLFYGNIPDDNPIDYHDVEVGKRSPEELADAIECTITSAEKRGMSRDGAQSLRQLVTEHKNVFRLKMGADSPANVKPLVIKLRKGTEPMRMSARKYAPPQLKFMRDKIREPEELGLIYKNTGAEWASPPLILPKPGPDRYRMTVDLRVPNSSTKPTACPIPNLQNKLHDLHQNYLRRWIFVMAIDRYLCTEIHKTVNRSSRRMEYTHRRMYYMKQETLRNICVCALRHD
jgi:hypothetical protein